MATTYSFEVVASHPVALQEYRLLLDSGRNAFTLSVESIDDFLELLRSNDIALVKAYDHTTKPDEDDLRQIMSVSGCGEVGHAQLIEGS